MGSGKGKGIGKKIKHIYNTIHGFCWEIGDDHCGNICNWENSVVASIRSDESESATSHDQRGCSSPPLYKSMWDHHHRGVMAHGEKNAMIRKETWYCHGRTAALPQRRNMLCRCLIAIIIPIASLLTGYALVIGFSSGDMPSALLWEAVAAHFSLTCPLGVG